MKNEDTDQLHSGFDMLVNKILDGSQCLFA